jgi:osmotically inducible protein OsmC
MATTRTADVDWEGDLLNGRGTVERVGSGVFGGLPVSWASRTEDPQGRTSPEELLAAAHASCFAMSLSGALARAGTRATHLHVSAAITFDKREDGWRVTSSALSVWGTAPGATAEGFAAAAAGAKTNCPISKALAGNVEVTVQATLEA